MVELQFVTADVFADEPFGGNQLAIILDGDRAPEHLMQRIAQEFDYSETTFVLPPERGGTARVRIFTRADEADFAGHPLVGTALVLSERLGVDRLILEVPAGDAEVQIQRPEGRRPVARVTTPSPFTAADPVDPAVIAETLGIDPRHVVIDSHAPTPCGMGREFVVTELTPEGLHAATPDTARFAAARDAIGRDRFSLLCYTGRPSDADSVDAVTCRMFSPLTGTPEDSATGSANVALAGLLLRHSPGRDELRLTSRQGEAMGRPSRLELHAWRDGDSIRASVAGAAIPVLRGTFTLG